MSRPLRVLIVDDNRFFRRIIRDILGGFEFVEIVGEAVDGNDAVARAKELRPDAVTLDNEMPGKNGLEVLQEFRKMSRPPAALMLSARTQEGAETTLRALELGAFDFVPKPKGKSAAEARTILTGALSSALQAIAQSGATPMRRTPPTTTPAAQSAPPQFATPQSTTPQLTTPRSTSQPSAPIHSATPPAAPTHRPRRERRKVEVVGIGISTGGPAALLELIPLLPENLAAPVIIVQHMPAMFTKSLAESLDRRSRVTVVEASDTMPLEAGTVYVAPGGQHLKISRGTGALIAKICDEPADAPFRPSVDVLFDSIARVSGKNAMAVIMTGMGSDGNEGCRRLHAAGASVLAQDETSCTVYGMPRLPAEEGLASFVGPPTDLAGRIHAGVGLADLTM